MADINKLKDKIKSTIYPNGKGAINASDHQAMLLDMADGMAETDKEIFVDSEEYMDTIAELYIVAPLPTEGYLSVKQYKGRIFVRNAIDSSTIAASSWQVNNIITDVRNNEIISLTCTTASNTLGVNVGDVVGYIIFKDIDKFKSANLAIVGRKVYEEKCIDISHNPIIKSSLISEQSLEMKLVEFNGVVETQVANVSNEIFVADQMKGSIAELHIIAPKNENVLLAVKHYKNEIFVRYGTNLLNNQLQENDANGWQCRMSLSTMKENEIIPLLCTTASNTLGVNVGDVVGYIIFKDLEKFKSVSITNVGFLADDNKCRDIRYSPVIHTSLLPKQEGSIASLVSGVNIYIPSTITAVVGDTMQIFWRSIVSARNPYIFDIVALGAVGKSYPRYFSFTPTSDQVGQTYVIKFCVRDNDGNDIVTKDVSIKVVEKASNPSSKKKVLCVGASATAGGQWVGELKRRLVETSGNGTAANPTGLGLSNYEFVGRKVGTSNPVNLEATGGWTIRSYASAGYQAIRFQVVNVDTLTIGATYTIGSTTYTIQEVNVTNGSGNIRCTVSSYSAPSSSGTLVKASGNGDATITYTSYQEENYSPFWNSSEGKIDFLSYANEYCGGSIDILIWHCGINDLASGGNMELTYSAYRNLLRAYHEQFPNGKVIISSVPIGSVNGGFAANYGANKTMNYWSFTKATMEFASALMDLCLETEFASYVRYSAAMEQFDAENGYPTSEVAVNNRSSIKEALGTNAVHPITEGSYQIADAVYRTMHNM